MPTDAFILELKKQITSLEEENKKLRLQIESARGGPQVELVREWTDGTLTEYKDLHDITTKNRTRLEVKYSKVHTLGSGVKRWTWDSILGENEKKEFDRLVLIGAKDQRYEYPDLPYVIFVIPREEVDCIKGRGNCLALNTNLAISRANNQKSVTLKRFLVRSQSEFEQFK